MSAPVATPQLVAVSQSPNIQQQQQQVPHTAQMPVDQNQGII